MKNLLDDRQMYKIFEFESDNKLNKAHDTLPCENKNDKEQDNAIDYEMRYCMLG